MAVIVQNAVIISWPGLLLRGIIALLFGVAAIFWPGITLVILDGLIGAYLLVSGVISMVESIRAHKHPGFWWLSLFLGAVELIVGIYLVRNPGIAIAAFITVVGFMLLIRGILEAVVAFERNVPGSEKTLALVGSILSIIAGVVIFLYPERGTLAFVWVLGVYAILLGIVLLSLAFDLKSEQEELLIEE